MDGENVFIKFNELLNECFDGNLSAFCKEYDRHSRDNSFYKKTQKIINRYKNKDAEKTVRTTSKVIMDFDKYILFLEAKKFRDNLDSKDKKLFDKLIINE